MRYLILAGVLAVVVGCGDVEQPPPAPAVPQPVASAPVAVVAPPVADSDQLVALRGDVKEVQRDMQRAIDELRAVRAELQLDRFASKSPLSVDGAKGLDAIIARVDAALREMRWAMEDVQAVQLALTSRNADTKAAKATVEAAMERFAAAIASVSPAE